MANSRSDNPRPRHVLAGGSGMLGRLLAASLAGDGADVVILTRSPDRYAGPGRAVGWDGRTVGDWAGQLDGAASVVNLAGASAASRWSKANRRAILRSRLDSVRAVGEAARACKVSPAAWLQASAVGVYGDRGEEVLTEASPAAPAGAGFLSDVCGAWEARFAEQSLVETRRATLRIGVVLGRGGGAYPALRAMTRAFLGGRVGDGRQWVPWIHQDDWTAAARFLLNRADLSGAFNLVGPHPVRNAELMAALRRTLGRPPATPAPAWAMRLGQRVLGVPAEAVLASQRAVPRRLEGAGFGFEFATLDAALGELGSSGGPTR